MSIPLKDHIFNRLNDSALTILYHIDDIHSYLETLQQYLMEWQIWTVELWN